MLRATSRLLAPRITLFTRANCSLCDTAKAVVGNVRHEKPLAYEEIDVMEAGQEKWKAVYEFDTPVIHVDKSDTAVTTTSSSKLMHRFKEEEIMKLLDELGKQ